MERVCSWYDFDLPPLPRAQSEPVGHADINTSASSPVWTPCSRAQFQISNI